MRSSSIFSGGGVPVGGLVPMWGASVNPTINGSEYLRSGNLKAIAGYTALSTSNPQLTWNVLTPAGGSGLITESSMRFSSSRYYYKGSGNLLSYVTALGSAQTSVTVDTDTTQADIFLFGAGQLIHVPTTAATIFSIDTATAIGTSQALTAATGYQCGAANSAGTLGMVCSQMGVSAGQIWTSTNGTAWTSRTPSVNMGGGDAKGCLWQPVSSTFAVLCINGKIATTADGFTLTDRGLPTGLSNVSSLDSSTGVTCRSDACAASPTVSLFSTRVTYTNGKPSEAVLIRSTDGVNFTATPWASLLPSGMSSVGITSNVRIAYGNGQFIATCGSASANDTGVVLSSTDGLTWTQLPSVINAYGSTTATYSFGYMNSQWVWIGSTGGANSPPIAVTSFTATHVGVPAAGSYGSGATLPVYVRIK